MAQNLIHFSYKKYYIKYGSKLDPFYTTFVILKQRFDLFFSTTCFLSILLKLWFIVEKMMQWRQIIASFLTTRHFNSKSLFSLFRARTFRDLNFPSLLKSSWQTSICFIYHANLCLVHSKIETVEEFRLFYLHCKISDIFGQWRNSGSILFVLQNFRHFWTVEEFRIYFICTAKFRTFMDGGGFWDLFYLYFKIPDVFGRWWNSGSILFVLQNSWHFRTV